jgi:GNAT superfamily N-acetyltransferase
VAAVWKVEELGVTMANLIKILSWFLIRDYSFYRIYGRSCADNGALPTSGLRFEPVEKKQIATSADRAIAEHAWYHDRDTHAYACLEDERIVGLCFFWHGMGYSKRNFWPLREHEAKLVQLFVLPERRGRGIARRLIEAATQDMNQQGFNYVYARIWRSNIPSLRAFERAGWEPIATVIEIFPRGRSKSFRLELRNEGS